MTEPHAVNGPRPDRKRRLRLWISAIIGLQTVCIALLIILLVKPAAAAAEDEAALIEDSIDMARQARDEARTAAEAASSARTTARTVEEALSTVTMLGVRCRAM